jgi:uncharacterized protein (TIGR00303 family)
MTIAARFNPQQAMTAGLIRALSDTSLCRDWLGMINGTPLFSCTIASTETAAIPHISAAGETPQKRRYTAALDAEVLLHGAPVTLNEIPKNPSGPPSPVVITMASLQAIGAYPLIIDAGTEVLPQAPYTRLGGHPGNCITTGQALRIGNTLINNCRYQGRWMAQQAPWLIFSESVPGGTTTALSLLQALGIDAMHQVSSSIAGGNHLLKEEVVTRALEAARLSNSASALDIAAAVGDPMQPAVALMALEASLCVPVLLGGGTQMVAVAALIERLHKEGVKGDLSRIALATTRWVAEDEHSNIQGLLRSLPTQIAAYSAELSFAHSSIPSLRPYEQGLVKEGVGAGAAAFAAFISGRVSHDQLLRQIESTTTRVC